MAKKKSPILKIFILFILIETVLVFVSNGFNKELQIGFDDGKFVLRNIQSHYDLQEKITEEINLQQVKILNGRAETFGKDADYREKYDIALSRAVARLNVLSEYCLPLVRVGGLLVAQKGRSYKEEIDKALKIVQLLGGELIGVENVRIPFINQERYFLVIKKIKDTPSKYPRKEGLPQKRPL